MRKKTAVLNDVKGQGLDKDKIPDDDLGAMVNEEDDDGDPGVFDCDLDE